MADKQGLLSQPPTCPPKLQRRREELVSSSFAKATEDAVELKCFHFSVRNVPDFLNEQREFRKSQSRANFLPFYFLQ